MRGENILYDLKTEVYDCPGHQEVVLWENESSGRIHVTSSEIKWRCDTVQAIACFNCYKASEKK